MKFYIPIVTIFLINSVASEVCYAGGMKNHPISANTEQPPCWYKSKDGTYSCFDLVHGACPFPGNIKPQDETLDLEAKKPESVVAKAKMPESANPGAKKPESANPGAKKPESANPEAKKQESASPEAKKPEGANPEAKKQESGKPIANRPNIRRPTICFRGNMKFLPVLARDSPPCWYKEKVYFSCYELDPKTKLCPDFPNRVKRPLL